MSIKTLYADLSVQGTISENGVALEDKYVSKDEEILTQEVICSHSGEITGNTNDEHGLAIKDQQMIISKIEGQTLIANNFVSFENATTQTINGITFTVNKEAGTVLANGTATDTAAFFFGCILNAYKNHKYLISAGRLFDGDSNNSYFGSGGWQVFRDFGSGGIISSREENTPYQDIAIVLKAGFVANNLLFVPQIIDLTLMFGYGNEPTLDEWKAMNMPLIPYSTGYVLNSKANLLSTTKNVCPRGQWIVGEWYDNYTGEVRAAGSSMSRFDAKIYVTNNIKYYLWTSKAFSSWQMYCYDLNDKYLGIGGDVGSTSGATPLLGTSYIRIAIWTDSSIDDGRIPAEYNVTPFERITEPLPYQSGELVVDQELGEWEYIDNNSNTKHSRVKSIDLGDLYYSYGADRQYFLTTITNAAPNIYSEDSYIINWVKCSRYATASNDQIYLNTLDMSIGVHKNSNTNNYYLNVRDSRYTDPALLRNALTGVKLYYLSNQEEVTSIEEPIAGGMPVWSGGQQSQVGQLPYILNKQYSLSLSAQVAANIQIDREQQTQINMFNQKVQGFATQDAINTACDELYEQISQDIQTEINNIDIQAPQSSINAPFLIQPFIGATRAMRLFGLPSDQVIVEASTDNGQTWTSTNEADWTKDQLFLQTRASSIKIPLKDNKKSCDCLLRVTITGMKYDVPEGLSDSEKYQYWNSNYALTNERYCSLDFGYFWVNALADRIYIEHQYSTGASPDNWIVDGVLNRAQGWTGGNYVKFGGGVTFGGGTTQLYNGWNHRFIFRTQASDGSFDDSKLYQDNISTQQSIMEISCYGQNCWGSSNEMMKYDRPYHIQNDKTVVFDESVTTSKSLYAHGSISNAGSIYTAGAVTSVQGFVFSGQADPDKKLLRADGWWQSVNDFASATHTHETIENDLTINGTATATELILTPNAFINTATISVIADAPDMTTIDISTNTQINGQLTADSASITNTLSAATILVGDVPVITSDDLRFKLLVPNQNTQSYAISTTLLVPLHEIIILISNNISSATANIKILQNDSTEIFSNNIAAGKVMRISGYRIGDSGLLFYGENQISSLTNCASGIYKVNSTVPVTLTIIGR